MKIEEYVKHFDLNTSEQKVLYILHDQIEKGNYKITIRELSELSFMATSSIVRLAKKVGFYGYSDMLYSFRKQSQEVVEFKTRNTLSSVSLSVESLNVLDELVNDLVFGDFKMVLFAGVAYSQYVAQYMADKLSELAIPASTISPMDLKVKKRLIIICISNSGETSDLIHIFNSVSEMDCKMYIITSHEHSTLCRKIPNKIVLAQTALMEGTYQNYFIGNAIILMENIAAAIYYLNKSKK